MKKRIMDLFSRKYVTVIMDASNTNIMNEIVKSISMMDYPRNRVIKLTVLDKDHPNTYAITHISNEKRYKELIAFLDEKFPGMCAYNVTV